MPCEGANGLLPGRAIGRGMPMPCEEANGLLPGRGMPGTEPGVVGLVADPEAGVAAAGLAAGAAAAGAADSLAAGFAGAGAGADGAEAAGAAGAGASASAEAGFAAAGFAGPALGSSAFGFAFGNASLSFLATGGAMVEEPLLTYSPSSLSFARASLVSMPSSLAMSYTRGSAT